MKEFGQKLKELRKSKNYKQNYVAEQLGISNKLLSGYERGVTVPPLDMLKRICEFYEVSSDYLLQVDRQEPSEGELSSGLTMSDLGEAEARFLKYYRQLDDEGKDAILGLMILMSKEDLVKKLSGGDTSIPT